MTKERSKSKPLPTVPLSDAPFAFWEKLFPEQPNVFVAPSRLIADQLSGKRRQPGSDVAPLPEKYAIDLLDVISIDREINRASICFPSELSWSAPLFPGDLRLWIPAWSTSNPLMPLMTGRIKDRIADSEKFFAWAVRCVGDEILWRLHNLLREGKLIAFARDINNPLGELREVPVETFGASALHLLSGQVTLQGRPILSGVRVRAAIELPADKSGGQSFEAVDQPLVEEMRQLILSKQAKNVTDAANQVAHKAKALGLRPDSVTKRLRTRYGRKYPTRPQRNK